MMTVLWWFIFRRWRFKKWTGDNTFSQRVLLIQNAWKVNLCGCRTYPVIHRDMQRILK